MFVSYEVKWRR